MSKREQELELEVWRTRQAHVQTSVNLLNSQAQLLAIQAKECKDNIDRLEAALKSEDVQPLKAVEG